MGGGIRASLKRAIVSSGLRELLWSTSSSSKRESISDGWMGKEMCFLASVVDIFSFGFVSFKKKGISVK